ncbi:MAG: hypothetical protein Harvfovirus8_29 [Harvfovirus sp.]|uniref:Uncharacterized protein n=1 Tax=Harvfovirus sp. TaxID=2487768 RepID=A0A3G5A0Y6_9VIRU|nr:MAG: hypothetical protein Harvfovirus8_29 [Harvfovirus sp.]
MENNIISLKKGTYYISDRNYSRTPYRIDYDRIAGKNYGLLRQNNKCIQDGFLVNCDENNPKQQFTLSADGRMFNQNGDSFLSNFTQNKGNVTGQVGITSIKPRSRKSISLWNTEPQMDNFPDINKK